MEKVLVVSQAEASELKKLLIFNKFKIVRRNPDFIIMYGGDGTVLYSERKFPEIPKLVIKKSNISRKYNYSFYDIKNILPKIREGKFRILKEIKLETVIKNNRLIALNEIQVRAKLPIYALRFSVSVNGKEYSNLIGDGVIISTPFGSTGYYKSTGGKKFAKGIGVSFNNLYKKRVKSIVVPEDSTIKTIIHRGPAWVLTDNYERFIELSNDDISVIKKSKSIANFIYVIDEG